MTFERKNSAYVDGVTQLTADVMMAFGRDIGRAVRGDVGRGYSPRRPLIVNGSGYGCSNLQTSRIGPGASLERNAAGHIPQLIDTSTIVDVGTVQVLDASSDVYWTALASTTNWQISLVTLAVSGVVAVDGQEIAVVKNSAVNSVAISNESPNVIVGVFPNVYSNQVSGSPFYARFRYDAATTTWIMVDSTADVSPS